MVRRSSEGGSAPIAAELLVALSLALVAIGCTSAEGDVLTTGAQGSPDAGLGGADCTALECPAAGPGEVVVCGHMIDLATSLPVTESPPPLRVFDLVDLQIDPTGATELAVAQLDECGRFAAAVTTAIPFVVIQTGEMLTDTPYRRVVSAFPTQDQEVLRINAYALRAETDVAWNQSAGLGNGGFASQRVLMAVFVDATAEAVTPYGGAPLTGVTITVNGNTDPNDDYYFAGDDPRSHQVIDPALEVTGVTGAGLVSMPDLVFGIFGGTRPNCVTTTPGTMLGLAGTLQVQEITLLCF